MKASSAAAWLAVGLAGMVVAAPAEAQGPVELSRAPIAENAAWKGYVLGTGTSDVAPVRIASVSGSVTNAEGLVDPSKGPATLSYTAGGQPPVIVLDYGREVGGLPFFTASAVTGGPVTLRSAYSETRQFLFSAGNTTLTLPAAAGDTNLKVGSVANFVVGDALSIGGQTVTIAAVGTQARSTTLFAAAPTGATNVKVAATTGLANGDPLRIDGENVTITNVGTQGRNTTLSAATVAGATNIRVASVTGMAAGDPIVVDGESRTVQTVGTAGANGTGVTLTAALTNAHASGAAVQDLGTGVTFAPALSADHASGATVIGPGTGITISAPLTAAQAAGTAVRATPGTPVGDANGFNGVGVAASRAENWAFSAPGTLGNAPNAIQGGERFQSLTLTTPGTLQLSTVGIHVRYPNAGVSDYVGHFLSSDSTLNKIWYQGAYTNDTNMVPIGAVPNQTIPVILDGAKRDRRPWSGDLDLQGKTMFSSLGFGAKGSDYIKGSIQLFGASQATNGSIFGHIADWTRNPPSGGFYSLSYSMYYVLNLASYYLYSGDLDFVRSQYAIVQRQMAYNRALVDPTTGLLISNSSERDWDFYDGGKPGAVTAYNAIYYKALSDASSMASELGNTADAATYAAQAADLKPRINATLFDSTRGVYKLADRDNANHAANSVPQDANAEAISFGIAPASAHAGILSWLRTNLWEPFGPQPYSAAANYSTVISPFVSGKEVDARFAAGDTQGALDLIHLLWDQMTNENGPYYTGAMWEKLNRDGTDVDANASLSHGWATAPTPTLSHYVLGAQPVTAGYKTWLVAPQTGDLRWAQGTVPTPQGSLVSRWARGDGDRSFTLTVEAPQGTSGSVRVPLLGRSRTIAMDGTVVWQDGAPQNGVSAVARDGAVEFAGVTGAHTFAFGTVTTDVPGNVGGTVPATLSLTLGAPASFGPFTPGVAKEYTASTSANVISTAGDAALSVSDPGHLANGSFTLPEPLRVAFSKASWTAPVSNDPVTITFSQLVKANDPLRTGTYSRSLTFTLSTTTP